MIGGPPEGGGRMDACGPPGLQVVQAVTDQQHIGGRQVEAAQRPLDRLRVGLRPFHIVGTNETVEQTLKATGAQLAQRVVADLARDHAEPVAGAVQRAQRLLHAREEPDEAIVVGLVVLDVGLEHRFQLLGRLGEALELNPQRPPHGVHPLLVGRDTPEMLAHRVTVRAEYEVQRVDQRPVEVEQDAAVAARHRTCSCKTRSTVRYGFALMAMTPGRLTRSSRLTSSWPSAITR